ncbi:DUF6204 family protein [Streptosporangium sp. NPDC050855]|uniref:DUF6204 family protein n=1 Tax=Streptosporangium sp. NPDC050855 TaxID=3366194 RepID=UPI00378E758A
MMFRVLISGTFDGLSDTDRSRLSSGADLLPGGFTEAGTFTCDSSLASFTFRCRVPPEDDGGDDEPGVTRRAVAALEAHGYPYRILRVAVTDMRDIKVRRKGHARPAAPR